MLISVRSGASLRVESPVSTRESATLMRDWVWAQIGFTLQKGCGALSRVKHCNRHDIFQNTLYFTQGFTIVCDSLDKVGHFD